jgi:hypothetical protein
MKLSWGKVGEGRVTVVWFGLTRGPEENRSEISEHRPTLSLAGAGTARLAVGSGPHLKE